MVKGKNKKLSFPKLVVTYYIWREQGNGEHIPYRNRVMDALKELILRRMNKMGVEKKEIEVPEDWDNIERSKLVVEKDYTEDDRDRPYIAVFTGESWKRAQKYREKYN